MDRLNVAFKETLVDVVNGTVNRVALKPDEQVVVRLPVVTFIADIEQGKDLGELKVKVVPCGTPEIVGVTVNCTPATPQKVG